MLGTIIPARRFANAMVRRMLQADLPAAVRSDEDVEAEAWRNYNWNFTVHVTDGAFFLLAQSLMSPTTILPFFVSRLTDNPFFFGLLAMIANGGWYFPQLLTAGTIERTDRKKPWLINLGFFLERLPLILLTATTLLAVRSPAWALGLFFLAFAIYNLGAGIIAPAWQDLLAVCFPATRRGRLMGVTMFVGGITGALGALGSSRILATLSFPSNFLLLFGLATILMFLGWAVLALTREPVRKVPRTAENHLRIWTRLGRILRRDQNFRRFLIARGLLAVSGMGMAFVTAAAISRWDVSGGTVGNYTVALLVGQSASNLLLGLLADRKGHKLALVLGGLAASLGYVIAGLAALPLLYYLVFILLGVYFSATFVSGLMIVLEFTGPEQRPTYVGITNSIIGAINVVIPLLGGWLATVNYAWLFALSAAAGLLGVLLMAFWVADPRHAAENA
ncbi:MAG: MFS transporter [Caldilineaceae bacterium SB0662_bin_25]|nr:MFS transporter [Caldilineaceae bacterium SB0662_bin_25]